MNTVLLILLRFIHVVAGTLWIGAAIFYLFFVKPSVRSLGPSGPQFMQSLAERRKYPLFMFAVSLLTVLAGIALYLYDSGGLNPAWLRTGVGLGFAIGSLAALLAFFVGGLAIGPTSARMGALGQEIGASGNGPTREQASLMQALEKRLARAEAIDFILLTIAILTMATTRYWFF